MALSVFPLFPGLPGGPELLIVLLVLVLLFGANKIPKLARSTGQAMGEFRRGREEIEKELEEATGADTADAEEDEDELVDTSDIGASKE
jgi:sec-independent protein translocase protein TatA